MSKKKLILPANFIQECEKNAFVPIRQGESHTFMIIENQRPQRILTVNTLKELLLAIVEEDQKFIFEDYTEESCRKTLIDLANSLTDRIPVRVTASSYYLLKALGYEFGVEKFQEKEKNKKLHAKIIEVYDLNKSQQKVLEEYATTTKISRELLDSGFSRVQEILSVELENLEEDVIRSKPWVEVFELFVGVWSDEEDSDQRKRVYRDLGYNKNPKKTKKENKKVLVKKFRGVYENLSEKAKVRLGDYLEKSTANLDKAKKLLEL